MALSVPLYEQLADQVERQIQSGVYRPGDRIPSVRRLRQQHSVSMSTVLQACRLLEDRGLLEARPQSGHYVLAPRRGGVDGPDARQPDPSAPTPEARRIDASLAVKLNLGIANPQEPTLGAAVQGPELMPVAAINRHMSQALRLQPTACHSYDAPPGSHVLRRAIAARGGDAGLAVLPDEIVITGGAKEAVYLSVRAVTRPGDTVAIASPAYYALLEVLASLDLHVVEVPTHPRNGIDLDALNSALSGPHRIAAVAMVSNFSNPTGSCMTDEAKQRLIGLLETHDVPLIEDDVYGDLAFDGQRPKAIKAFDRHGLVLYCGSYSKTLSPGLRIGWAIPGRYQNQVELLKLVVNQASATAPQLAIASFLETGGFDRHLRRVRRMYRDQMAQTIAAVERYFPAAVRFTRPEGGHVLWVQLPPSVDAMALYEAAAAEHIRVAPGPMFSASGDYRDFIRLNTGFPWSQLLHRQVSVLGRLVTEMETSSTA